MDANQVEQNDLPQIVNLSQVKANLVQADMVRANTSAIQKVDCDEIDLQTSVVGSIRSNEINSHQDIIGSIHTQQAAIQHSHISAIQANTLNFDGSAALILSNNISGNAIRSFANISSNIQSENIHTGVLLSREVHGNVTTLLILDQS